MRQLIKIFISLFLTIFLTNISFSINLTEYEYNTKINVDCDEYIGYVIFNLPAEFDTIQNPKSYFDNGDFFIIKKHNIESFQILNNWYSNKIDNLSSVEIEKLTDRNYNNYLLTETENNIEINLANPQMQQIDKIQIDVKDTVIEDIELYDSNNQKIEFSLQENLFTYTLLPNSQITADELKLKLSYNELLKIEEITLYKKRITPQNSQMYFEVNNNCQTTFNLYYGNYGKDYAGYSSNTPHILKSFNVNIENNKNSLYIDDFDSDGIKNINDNCIKLANEDQADINYNKIGDACEDFDSDSILNKFDNCPEKSNRDQLDDDRDGLGNVCDTDDNRFIESNKIIVYVVVVIVCMLFLVLSINLFKKK